MKRPLLHLCLLLLPLPVLAQGNLTPAGAPAPTMKSLDQLDAKLDQVDAKAEKRTPISSLPFTITNSGSYYLNASLRGTAGSNGITVNASHVTIDLNGFRLNGSGTNGAIVSTGQSNIEVRNGVIDGWAVGIDMAGATAVRVENVRAVNNTGGGITTGARSVVDACRATGNGGHGIQVGAGSIVLKCVVAATSGDYSRGIHAGADCLVIDAVVRETSGYQASGIRVSDGSAVIRCNVSFGSGTDANGILTATKCRVIDCVADDNNGTGASGIRVGGQTLVNGCTATSNGGDGISAYGGTLLNNSSASNGGAGIRLTHQRARVEGNHVTHNTGPGIMASGNVVMNNLIIRNSAGSNTGGDYVIGAGNGFSGTVSIANVAANTNPHVNFDLD